MKRYQSSWKLEVIDMEIMSHSSQSLINMKQEIKEQTLEDICTSFK